MIKYETENLILRTLELEDIHILKEYIIDNIAFMEKWSPKTDSSFYETENLEKIVLQEIEQNKSKSTLKLHIFLKEKNKLIGSISLSNIVYGPFLSCFLGYKLHKDYIKKGYMSEALEKIIHIAFKEFKLHRIEANIIPQNIASQKLVQKFGFENEGLSKKYLKINGVWEDHYHFVLLNKDLE